MPQEKIKEQSVSVAEFYEMFKDALQLELAAGSGGMKNELPELSLNRPSLALTGYFKNFSANRIQLFGAGEMSYLRDQNAEAQIRIMESVAARGIPCIVVSRNIVPTRAMLKVAESRNIPLIRTRLRSKEFANELRAESEKKFAPQISLHGTFLDVKGIGVLIRGQSGVGKSECALALVDHGHSLVADDMTYCVKIGKNRVIGKSSELNRGYMECRGIGIIDVTKLYGIRCLRLEKQLDLVITFVEWKPGIPEERTGLEKNFFDVLGVQIPHFEIPVRPGRDMARLVEVAAMVQALREIGHDAAAEFNQHLIDAMKV
ncbi:MAG: HPr(Ser) kinase/phosphatase [Opitutales bacterium]|nr:HPr(Ser) kinase/phosphatase [Opitutales bacterium]